VGVGLAWLLWGKREYDPLTALLLTFGIMLILQQLAAIFLQTTTGSLRHSVMSPLRWPILVGDRFYEGYRLVVAAIAGVVLAGFWGIWSRTRWGCALRAVRDNRELARVVGIPVLWAQAGAFGVGAALAALAGELVGPITREVSPTMAWKLCSSACFLRWRAGLAVWGAPSPSRFCIALQRIS
jgi:branched-subunit amino acid ABC-type transport system permease component